MCAFMLMLDLFYSGRLLYSFRLPQLKENTGEKMSNLHSIHSSLFWCIWSVLETSSYLLCSQVPAISALKKETHPTFATQSEGRNTDCCLPVLTRWKRTSCSGHFLFWIIFTAKDQVILLCRTKTCIFCWILIPCSGSDLINFLWRKSLTKVITNNCFL